MSLPKVATRCHLQGIQPADGTNAWSAEVRDAMKDVMSKAKSVSVLVSGRSHKFGLTDFILIHSPLQRRQDIRGTYHLYTYAYLLGFVLET